MGMLFTTVYITFITLHVEKYRTICYTIVTEHPVDRKSYINWLQETSLYRAGITIIIHLYVMYVIRQTNTLDPCAKLNKMTTPCPCHVPFPFHTPYMHHTHVMYTYPYTYPYSCTVHIPIPIPIPMYITHTHTHTHTHVLYTYTYTCPYTCPYPCPLSMSPYR